MHHTYLLNTYAPYQSNKPWFQTYSGRVCPLNSRSRFEYYSDIVQRYNPEPVILHTPDSSLFDGQGGASHLFFGRRPAVPVSALPASYYQAHPDLPPSHLARTSDPGTSPPTVPLNTVPLGFLGPKLQLCFLGLILGQKKDTFTSTTTQPGSTPFCSAGLSLGDSPVPRGHSPGFLPFGAHSSSSVSTMTPARPYDDAANKGSGGEDSNQSMTPDHQAYDDAEKGLYDNTPNLPVIPAPPLAHIIPYLSNCSDDEKKTPILEIESSFKDSTPTSPIHEGKTPFSSVQALSLSWLPGWKGHGTAPDGKTGTIAPNEVKKAPGGGSSKKKLNVSRWVLFDLWFNTYRKFFTFVTLLNTTGIILTACGKFAYAESHMGALVLGNLLAAILMRNELFLRFCYTIAIYGLRGVCAPIFF